jgi:hypothetical protein
MPNFSPARAGLAAGRTARIVNGPDPRGRLAWSAPNRHTDDKEEVTNQVNTTQSAVLLGTDNGQPVDVRLAAPGALPGGTPSSGKTSAAAVGAQLAVQGYAETRTPAAPAATEGEERRAR